MNDTDRSLYYFCEIQNLISRYNIQPTKIFSIHDNADELECEYALLLEKTRKDMDQKSAQNIFFMMCYGMYFLENKYGINLSVN